MMKGVMAVSGLLLACSATGQQVPSTGPRLSLPLLVRLGQGQVLERYLADLIEPVRRQDRDGDGLDARDLDRLEQIGRARVRASLYAEVLDADLNGDGRVTRAELVMTNDGGRDAATEAANAELGRFDNDGDGVITMAELAALANDRTRPEPSRALLRLDPDGDGRLTTDELRTLGRATFAAVDRDGDGVISADEYRAVAEQISVARSIEYQPNCVMPPVPAGAQLVAFGSYEADALSSVAVGGPDRETNYMDVAIEPGATPLYLVLASYESMIWRLHGAIGRVRQVVASSLERGEGRPIASGVIGVPRAAVTVGRCPGYFSKADDADAARARATIEAVTGRAPDVLSATYSAQSVSLPSGVVTRAPRDTAPVPRGFDAAEWREAIRYWPAGLVTVDARSVVSPASARPYQVLPSQMGIAQLLGAGALERTPRGFRIVRPIAHMPPSMGGAHAETLILAPGVPIPPGDTVHACIVREDGTRQGAICGLR